MAVCRAGLPRSTRAASPTTKDLLAKPTMTAAKVRCRACLWGLRPDRAASTTLQFCRQHGLGCHTKHTVVLQHDYCILATRILHSTSIQSNMYTQQ